MAQGSLECINILVGSSVKWAVCTGTVGIVAGEVEVVYKFLWSI